jgi:hypothetical protein
MSDPNALPIAGWYPDPENEAGDRWWNGATWSDHRRPRNAPAGWAPATPAAAKNTAAPAADATVAAAPAAASAAPVVAGVPAVPVAPVNPYATSVPQPNPYAASQPMFQPAQPGYQPYAPAYAPNYAPAQPMRNPLALGGMVTSLIAILFNFILFGAPGIAGAIVSFFGLRTANRLVREGVTVGNGKAMAITGIVVGLVGAFLWDLFYFTVMSPLNFS